MTDKDIYHQVRRDAVAGNSSVGNRTIVHLLDSLVHVYGDDFTIDGAVNALDSLTTMAAIWKDELRKAKARRQVARLVQDVMEEDRRTRPSVLHLWLASVALVALSVVILYWS